MIKKVIALFLVLLLPLSLFACNNEADEVETTAVSTPVPVDKIGVLSLTLDENTLLAYSGFVKALAVSGYIDGDNIELIKFECEEAKALSASAQELVDSEVKLIYAIGTDAAKAAKKATSDIPVVFSCVNDPIGDGLVKSCEKPEANVTGVCDYSPVFEQIELITKLYPDVKRIGCLYNGADEESIFSANLAKGEALNRGVKFTLYPALTENEYEDELETALEKCDVLYLADDALVKSCLEYTLKQAKKKKVPVFAEEGELVAAGCLATCISDYMNIGYTAGELSAILLRSLKTVSEIPVEYAADCNPVINADTQKALKLSIDKEILDNAVIVNTAD